MKSNKNQMLFLILSMAFPMEKVVAQAHSVGEMRMFSRANCPTVNESITWSPLQYRKIANLEVISMQTSKSGSYNQYSSFQNRSMRVRAGCNLCSIGGMSVIGWHYLWANLGEGLSTEWAYRAIEDCKSRGSDSGIVCRISGTTDCSISEGWF